ncbi:hypothetical protein FB446DRAFT_709689 [Lentinula raphanica]|nr:hypothetical protein FB446DRAFT_709689 [Lentinula raphanica]
MWPREVDDKGRMKLLRSELGKLGNKSLLLSLKKITSSDNPQELADLITFSSRVQWLLDEQRYHQKLDLEERTTEGQPFQSSLITKILQAYFVNKNSKLDHFLIQRMKDEKAVPVRLIIMIATLVRYRLLCLNMRDAKIKVESYPQALSEMFYEDMMAIDYRGENYQEPKYDYNLLASWAEAQLNKRKNGRQLQEDQGEGSSKGKGSRAEGSRAPGGSRGGAGGGSGGRGDEGEEADDRKYGMEDN